MQIGQKSAPRGLCFATRVTGVRYAWSGLVSWELAGVFVTGGIAGGLAGTRAARLLAERRGALNIVFAVVIIAVALYMLAHNLSLF